MARLSVVAGAPRRGIVFPAETGDIRRLLKAAPSAAFALTGDLISADTFAASFGASAALTADLAGGENLRAVLNGAAAFAAGVQQTQHLGAALAGTGALTGDLDVSAGGSDPAFRAAAVTYTGNGGTQSITGVGFEPDMVIIMAADVTSGADRHVIDKGNGVGVGWQPGGGGFPAFDNTQTFDGITSFDADGFSLGSDSRTNGSGQDYVAVCFAPGTGTETANFQVQKITNTAGSQAFAHTLGTTPVWAWCKDDEEESSDWITDAGTGVASVDLGGTLVANANTVEAVSASDITLGDDLLWNAGSDDVPLYLFGGDEASGAYKTGTYSGTGGSGNAITGLGFQPSVVMIRSLDGTGACVLSAGFSPQSAFNLLDGGREGTFSLDADGFTVDGSGAINRSGENFRYFAWV